MGGKKCEHLNVFSRYSQIVNTCALPLSLTRPPAPPPADAAAPMAASSVAWRVATDEPPALRQLRHLRRGGHHIGVFRRLGHLALGGARLLGAPCALLRWSRLVVERSRKRAAQRLRARIREARTIRQRGVCNRLRCEGVLQLAARVEGEAREARAELLLFPPPPL